MTDFASRSVSALAAVLLAIGSIMTIVTVPGPLSQPSFAPSAHVELA